VTTNFTVSGLLNGDTVTEVTVASIGGDAVATVGSYTLEATAATGSGLTNYTISYTNGTLTVGARSVTLTNVVAADKAYDGTTVAALSSGGVSNAVNGDDVVVVPGTGDFASPYVGTRSVLASNYALDSSGAATNYSLSGQPVVPDAQITNARVTVVSGLSVDNKVYDGTTAATLVSNSVVLAGVAAIDVGSVSLVTNGSVATFTTNRAGASIPVTISGLTLIGDGITNYTLIQPAGLTADITQASVSVTANPQTKVYGEVNPDLTAVTNGVLNGDPLDVTIATDATQYSGAGAWDITVTAGNNPNYSIATTNSTLTINAKAATVAADAQTKTDAFLAAKPRDPQMRFLKGVIQRDSGKVNEAIATFNKLTEDYPELPEPYNNLAVRQQTAPSGDPTVIECKFAYQPAIPLNYITVSFSIDLSSGAVTSAATTPTTG
jgi:hypothetical protein